MKLERLEKRGMSCLDWSFVLEVLLAKGDLIPATSSLANWRDWLSWIPSLPCNVFFPYADRWTDRIGFHNIVSSKKSSDQCTWRKWDKGSNWTRNLLKGKASQHPLCLVQHYSFSVLISYLVCVHRAERTKPWISIHSIQKRMQALVNL